MENVIKYFNNIESSFKRMKNLSIVVIMCSVVFAGGACYLAYDFASRFTSQVYVLDHGSVLMAKAAAGDVQRDLEAIDHVTRFHEFLFNLSPNKEAIQRNVDRALTLSDESAYNYWRDLTEKGYYQRLISANISQQMVVDSVKVDMQNYPYTATTYGTIYVLRESNITAYGFESQCQIIDAERSAVNPHGMMIEKFVVTRNENLGTKPRN